MESYEDYFRRMTTKEPRPELEQLVHPWDCQIQGPRQTPQSDMVNAMDSEVATWSLTLIDEIPGPSTGDAMEYIDWLGLDWRDFKTEISSEELDGEVFTTRFLVSGAKSLVERLRKAHKRRMEYGGDDGWYMQAG